MPCRCDRDPCRLARLNRGNTKECLRASPNLAWHTKWVRVRGGGGTVGDDWRGSVRPADAEGEDELESFPLPPAARDAEAAAVTAVLERMGRGATPGDTASEPPAADAIAGDVTPEPLTADATDATRETPDAGKPAADTDATLAGGRGEDAVPTGLSPTIDAEVRRYHEEMGLVASDADAAAPLPEVVGGGGRGGGGALVPSAGAPGGDDGKGRRKRWLEITDRPMTIFEHLDELRRRLVWAVLAFVVGMGTTFLFVQPLLVFTERNAARNFNIRIIAGAPMAPMFASIRLAAVGGILLGSPIIFYQIVAYVLPALTAKERKMLFGYLPVTGLLFAVGLSFGFFVFEPIALRVSVLWLSVISPVYTLDQWVQFLLAYATPFGLIFELPVVIALLVKLGVLTPDTLVRGRRWALMLAVVVAMMFAPPADPIVTPSLIAGPVYGLYEISIFVARIAYRQRQRAQAADEG